MTIPDKVDRVRRGIIARWGTIEKRRQPEVFEHLSALAHSSESPFTENEYVMLLLPSTLDRRPRSAPESPKETELTESRLASLERNVEIAIDIGLENRKLLERLLEDGASKGIGAIHSLDEGKVHINPPLIYNVQELEDEIVTGIEELGIYGVGATEFEAVGELQEELWSLVQDLEQTPSDEIGTHLKKTMRILRMRMQQNAMDA